MTPLVPHRRWIAALLLPLSGVLAQSPAVSIDHEAKHHLVFSNDWVRVFDVVVPAGDSTLYHVHPVDYAYVTFGDVSLKAQAQGAEQTDLALTNGEVRMTVAPITHRVLNRSSVPFHNLTIELLKSSGVPLAPANAETVVLDNARVRVLRIVLAPGQSTAQHDHRGPGLDVAVSGGEVHMVDANGAQDHRVYSPASYRWNGAPRVHTLTNVGSTRVELVEIEWK
jgi:quercetin dioxygenase-like cupin family protein